MSASLKKLAMAQLNYIVGDIEGNLQKILKAYNKICKKNALLVCSELAITGYYPQDLVTKKSLLKRQDKALKQLIRATQKNPAAIVVGYIARNRQATGKGLFNALALLSHGEQVFEYHKRLLPTYNVFDEARHFCAGDSPEPGSDKNTGVFEYKGCRIGFLICEDAWPQTEGQKYLLDPVAALKNQQLDLVISINASPNNIGKMKERYHIARRVVRETKAAVVYVNQIGGNDELVFDGASFVMNKSAKLACQLKPFQQDFAVLNLEKIEGLNVEPLNLSDTEIILNQTVLGVRDYIGKCGFKKAVVGSSGGIDSAVTLAICVEALGCENVTAITMPSRYSSKGSITDSVDLCNNLGVNLLFASIQQEFELSVKRFEIMCGEKPSNLTRENIQARIRGRILMEYSNHFGSLVISTGNKSEMSVGYATLYGDMNGAINPLGDLYKMQVYALAKLFNERAGIKIIPQIIIDKQPSAELSAGQKDSDLLPAYPLLDAILMLYIEEGVLDRLQTRQCRDLIKKFAATNDEIKRIHQMVDAAEFKRRQAPPIIRVQKRSFGMGRWLPVAAKY